jgi:glycosyltransferase involved in cell wall biosynthesis
MLLYSIIIPAYNASGTLGRCLEALLKQSVLKDSYEVIVIDDGSTDGTSQVVKSFPVRSLRQENRGPAAARNHGAREAQGRIILFTDADCVPEETWIEEMVKPFSDPSVTAVKGAYRTRQCSFTARFAQVEFEERFALLKQAPSIDMVDTYSAAYRREVFLQVSGFDESFPAANNEDTELSYKLSRMGHKMVFNPDAVVYHLNHPASPRRYARLKFWRGYWRMVVYRRYPDKMMKDTYTPQTLKLQILFLFLFLAFAAGMLFWPGGMGYTAAAMLVLFGLAAAPFAALAFRRDPVVGILSPLFLSLRAASLGLGFIWGFLHARTDGKKA